MTIMSDPNLWVICGLVFLLGLLVGMFMTAGGRRKWKSRYREEETRREQLEREHRDLNDRWDKREKEWSSRESARDAAIRDNRRDSDVDGDGVRDTADRRPTDSRKA